MPEGDTIFRAARTLHAALAGRTVTRFSGGPALHTHMRMTGSWHLYRQGSRSTYRCPACQPDATSP